jgi:hypothetical protein
MTWSFIERGRQLMKLRLIIVLSTMTVASILLFGGWSVYQENGVKKPLIQSIQQFEGVQDVSAIISRDNIHVTVQLAPATPLRYTFQQIASIAEESWPERDLQVDLNGNEHESLTQWWSLALFDVAQAMEARQYTEIPRRLQELANQDGLTVITEMDDRNVYITLNQHQFSKYIVLPRIAPVVGVWSYD